MSFIFFDEFGSTPLGYTGFSDELAIILPTLIGVLDTQHKVYSNTINVGLKIGLPNSQHSVYSDTLNVKLKVSVLSSIHKLYTHKDINAPVIFKCDSYLNTPFISRVLETEKESRILDTPYESRILETLYEC